MSESILESLDVLNGISSINQFLKDRSLELPESEEVFDLVKNFETIQNYILSYIEQESEKRTLANVGIER